MATLRRLASYLRPYPGLVVLMVITMLLGIAAELAVPRILGMLVDRGLAGRSMAIVWRFLGLLAIVALARSGIRYVQSLSRELIGQSIIRSLRAHLYRRLQRLSFTYYTVNNTGDLMSRMTGDVESVWEFFGFGLGEMLSSALMFLGTLGMMLYSDWRLALVVMTPVPVLMFFAFRFSHVIGPLWEKIREEFGRLSTTLQENVSGVRVVKSYSREEHEIGKFRANNEHTLKANLVRASAEAQTFPLLNFVTGLCFLLLYWYGGMRVIGGRMTIGVFLSFNWFMWGLIWPIRFLGYLINVAKAAIAAGPRLFEILDAKQEIAEKEGALELPAARGHIRFENVHFAFEDGDHTPVLQGMNMEVLPGQIVAVLGGTGSGKSSVINLIPRFYDPQQGRITIDGTDIREVTLDSLRGQIGIVPQETFLFSDTVHNNVAFGRPAATREQVVESAQAAQADEFVSRMVKGYDTRVGERGVGVSGGQKQRIAIARALLYDPRILILDEATSSVDAETEHALQTALARLMKGRTSIVIAQRLSTIKNADKVVVLRDGVVAEEGTHEELLRQGGEYMRIYDLQLRPQEELHYGA